MSERKAGKRGLLPSTRFGIALDDYLVGKLPAAPAAPFDYASKVAGGFPMAGNDQFGDCTIAGVIHVLQLCYAVVGEMFEYPGDQAVEETYFNLTGGEDTGLNMETVLSAWSTGDGLFGTRLKGWGTVNAGSRAAMRSALYNFGHLYLAGDIPQEAEVQFEDHEWWMLEPGRNPAIGGHCFVGCGDRPNPPHQGIDNITWGAETGFTWNWWASYGQQAFVVIPDVFVSAGHGPLRNIAVTELEADCRQFAEAA